MTIPSTSPEEFTRRWIELEQDKPSEVRSPLIKAQQGKLSSLQLPPETVDFFANASFPDFAAPDFYFDDLADGFPRIDEVWFSDADWPEWAQREKLQNLRCFGADGSGNPFCVEEASGRVLWLDHDTLFSERLFVNTSIVHLASCLLAYSKLAATFDSEDRVPEPVATEFVSRVRSLDPAALEEGQETFWGGEIECLTTIDS